MNTKNNCAPLGIPPEEKEIILRHFPQGIVAFDLETTGLSPLVDHVVEISGVKVTAGTDTAIECFSQLVDPGIPMPANVQAIHGIDDAMVKGQPKFDQALKDFLAFCGDLPLLAHNAKFDIGFLVSAKHRYQVELPKASVYCSCQWSRSGMKHLPSHKLSSLTKSLKIPLENHHRALNDAVACLRVMARGLLYWKEKHPNATNTAEVAKMALLFRLKDFDDQQDLNLPELLVPLVEMVRTQSIVDIKYQGGSYRNELRPIKPISLLPMPDGGVLYALCLKSNIYKSFSLRKIRQVELLDQAARDQRWEAYQQIKKASKNKTTEADHD